MKVILEVNTLSDLFSTAKLFIVECGMFRFFIDAEMKVKNEAPMSTYRFHTDSTTRIFFA